MRRTLALCLVAAMAAGGCVPTSTNTNAEQAQAAAPRKRFRVAASFPMRPTSDSDTLKGMGGPLSVLAASAPAILTGGSATLPIVAAIGGLVGAKWIERKSDMATVVVEWDADAGGSTVVTVPPTGGVTVFHRGVAAPPVPDSVPAAASAIPDWINRTFSNPEMPQPEGVRPE